MLADGPQRGRPIRSRTKGRRLQLTLGILLFGSLFAFSCVVDSAPSSDWRTAASSTSSAGAGGSAEGSSGGSGGSGGSGDRGERASTTLAPYDGWVNPKSSGRPYGAKRKGLLTFRGNPTRTYYGEGPVPKSPAVQWSVPSEGGLCGESADGKGTRTWCGTGWTGQPSVFAGLDDKTWVAFGAYDKAIHVLDAATGEDARTPFPTGDIIKGSVTIDPDGFPIIYSGSRDNKFHILAFDRGMAMEELWTLDAEAVSPTLWNNDWDGSALVLDDYLFEGGENSQIHVVKLNRKMGADGKVTVAPELVWNAPGWDDELLSALSAAGTRGEDVSIENSVAISGNILYFSNSGGLVQGWDIGGLAEGKEPTRTFRFWSGDDTDASVVIDDEGFLYVASEFERGLDRAEEIGQLMKLDPRRPDDPLVWSIKDQDSNPAGIWATPAIHGDMLYVPTNGGRLLGVEREAGRIRWTKKLTGPTWQSPVVVDDVLLQGDCDGTMHAYDVSEPGKDPPELWTVKVEGCIESTPAVWEGQIFFGARGGKFYALSDD